jgi:hypothetical protein
MAILLEIHYDKRLGLPGYSSHDFGVSLKTEVTDLDQIRQESERAYQILQKSVDSQIIHCGYVPEQVNNSGKSNQEEKDNTSVGIDKNDNNTEKWNCTVRQKDLILNVLERNNLDPQTANELGVELHGKKMDRLTKLQVSGVITELLNRFGRKKNKGGAQ